MARIDSILSIVVQQGATELRVGTDREPKMFARGTPKRLAIPVTPDDMLRHLMGDLFSPEREAAVTERGRVDFAYDAGPLGTFQVTITGREGGFDAIFVRSAARAAARPAPAPVVVAPVVTPPSPAPEIAHVPVATELRESAPPGSVQDATFAAAHVDGALTAMLGRAVASRASDVHLLNGEAPTIRIDGRLRPLEREIGHDDAPIDVERLLGPLFTPHVRQRIAAGGSADAAFEIDGLGRFRLNVYRAAQGLAAAIRVLARSAPTLASLRLPVPIDELAMLPHGLVLVCGPTGSGKSTTLAALAGEALRKRSVVLITLEEPIEYTLASSDASSLVRQREIGRDVRDFATGLRDSLREDPDVLLIGEMRDPETISLALTAAETGHLVLASLHSRSAASAVERIVDSYPPERQQQIRVQLADALRAVVSIRLLPRAQASGRVAAIEVMRGTHSVASVIREGKTAQLSSAIQSGRREGMLALERCLADLVQSAQITIDDARAVANDPASLASYLGK
jgi:twitching motility protein PilT